MSKKLAVFMLAGTLVTSGAASWASAGDVNQQGTNGTTTGTPAVKTPKNIMGNTTKRAVRKHPQPPTPPARPEQNSPAISEHRKERRSVDRRSFVGASFNTMVR